MPTIPTRGVRTIADEIEIAKRRVRDAEEKARFFPDESVYQVACTARQRELDRLLDAQDRRLGIQP